MFAALDAEGGLPPGTWIHAGARQAEAGYLDPALGWVGVRADAAGTSVHATIVPASEAAAHTLGTHMSELNAFLADGHGPAATVTLAATSQDGSGFDRGYGSGGNRDGRESMGGNEGAPETLRTNRASTPELAMSGASAVFGMTFTRGGNHISVVA